MTTKDAKELAKWMHGLFPTMTAEQVCLCADEFLKHDAGTVRDAIKEHRFAHEFSDISQIREAIGAVKRREISDTSAQRRKEKQIQDEWQHMSEIVCALPDDNLNDLKQKALLLKIPAEMREFYAGRDPRRNKSLIAAIYELIEAEGTVAA